MEFITVEQFKEQPQEIQKVFIDWWKPSIGDLFIDLAPNNKKKLIVIEDEGDCIDIELIKSEIIPLFKEGQLRKFIEDKTNTKTETSLTVYKQYALWLVKVKGSDYEIFDTREGNLLQAYWRVACMVAKEGLDESDIEV